MIIIVNYSSDVYKFVITKIPYLVTLEKILIDCNTCQYQLKIIDSLESLLITTNNQLIICCPLQWPL